jgi:hypothetical protein
VSHEIEDTYLSHLDLNGFCTIDNTLQGVAGDIRTIDTYSASGTAIDVAEGEGNTDSIATTLTPQKYQVKCAQAWFRYSDEALMRDPVAVQTGLGQLGIAMFNKVNADFMGELKKLSTIYTATEWDIDLFGGSGTTIMAAEQNGRVAFVMEYDPKFVDVIIRRWEEFTGGKAELVSKTTPRDNNGHHQTIK